MNSRYKEQERSTSTERCYFIGVGKGLVRVIIRESKLIYAIQNEGSLGNLRGTQTAEFSQLYHAVGRRISYPNQLSQPDVKRTMHFLSIYYS